MASNTQKLELYKVNPQTDGDMTFNIETMLNQNWDKVDNFAQEVENKLNEVDDVEEAVLMIIEKIGSLNQLDTDTKNDLVAAVNEVHQKFVAHKADFESLLSGGQSYNATLQNGWTGTLTYKKNDLGQVFLHGILTAGTITSATTVADFPEEFKPISATMSIPAYSSSVRNVVGFHLFRSSIGLSIYDTNVPTGTTNIRIAVMYQADI